MALEAGQKLRQSSGYASGSLFHHHCMPSGSVVGRDYIQIVVSRVRLTSIVHGHLPNYSKHTVHE